jgi:hypothetical protein
MNASLEKDKIEIIKWVVGIKDKWFIEKLKMLKENPNVEARSEDEIFGEILKKSKRTGRLSEKETKAFIASLR